MKDESKIPRMLVFLFGDAAETAQRGASSRLKRWSQAFDEWLADQQRNYSPGTCAHASVTWRRLLRERGKLPWELTQQDIEQHAAWMQAQGYVPSTIYNALGYMARFYRWCDERHVDKECQPGFNPAAAAPRPKIQRYAGAKLLSQGELQALLGIMKRDHSPLGRRDYAFFLARLRLGVRLRSLQQLRWEQIEHDKAGVWLRWRPGARRVQLPGELWQAIQAWLEASGRLAGMRLDSYVFAPLVDPLHHYASNQPAVWAEGRYISNIQILGNLKLYGRRVGIPEDKLNLMALRRSAIRLRLEAGDSLEQMQAFLDSQEAANVTRHRLGKLAQLPQDVGAGGERAEDEPALPVRKPNRFQPGEGMTHGLYAHSLPPQEVLAMLAEDIQGIDAEITGLRTLERGLVEMQAKARSSKQSAQLADACMLTATRLAAMIEAEKQLAKVGDEDTWAEDFLAMMDRVGEKNGTGPVSEAIRAAARGDEAELTAGSRRLVEEVAATRLVLRNTLALARQAEQKGETEAYIRLTGIYGNGCNRLMRLLRAGKADQARLVAYLREQIDIVIREVSEEWKAGRLASGTER